MPKKKKRMLHKPGSLARPGQFTVGDLMDELAGYDSGVKVRVLVQRRMDSCSLEMLAPCNFVGETGEERQLTIGYFGIEGELD